MTYRWSYEECISLEDNDVDYFISKIQKRNRDEAREMKKNTKKPRRR